MANLTPEQKAEALGLLGDTTREGMRRLAELTGGKFTAGRDHMQPFEDSVSIPAAVARELFDVPQEGAPATLEELGAQLVGRLWRGREG